jgi:hypothetical protein
MSSFKKALTQSAKNASELPSFPQKGQEYHIDAIHTRFDPIEDTYQDDRENLKNLDQ